MDWMKSKIFYGTILTFTGMLFIFSQSSYNNFTSSYFYQEESISDLLDDNVDIDDMLTIFWNLEVNYSTPNCSQNNVSSLKTWIPNRDVDSFYVNLIENCSNFKNIWKYPNRASSEEEEEYPLAYVVMGYKNLPQTLRLFRAIYQPQNVYCINWDNKSDSDYKLVMTQLSACFINVIMPEKRREINWCDYSVLQATMDCLEMLFNTSRSWNYVQIVSWNDFPLKTNRELVQIMKILNGTVDVGLNTPQQHTFYREFKSKVPNPIPPSGLVLYKSSYAVTMPRNFVTFMFENIIARNLYLWFNNSICTEEMYFSTLAHNIFLKAPGGFPGSCLQFYNDDNRKHFISRYQIWVNQESLCKGYFTSDSCVFGVEDVSKLQQQRHLIAHKFYEEFEPAALYCLEEWHYKKIFDRTNISEAMIKFYSSMQSVHYHELSDNEKNSFVCES